LKNDLASFPTKSSREEMQTWAKTQSFINCISARIAGVDCEKSLLAGIEASSRQFAHQCSRIAASRVSGKRADRADLAIARQMQTQTRHGNQLIALLDPVLLEPAVFDSPVFNSNEASQLHQPRIELTSGTRSFIKAGHLRQIRGLKLYDDRSVFALGIGCAIAAGFQHHFHQLNRSRGGPSGWWRERMQGKQAHRFTTQ